jgi:hypothetical protein
MKDREFKTLTDGEMTFAVFGSASLFISDKV